MDSFGIAHFWSGADAVIRVTAWTLGLMSLACWSVIFWKLLAWRRARAAAAALDEFFAAPDLAVARQQLRAADPDRWFAPLADALDEAGRPAAGEALRGRLPAVPRLASLLRRQMDAATARHEAGLTLLASVASTAPFVGLFGTVWGIYHAMVAVAASGSASIERLAGPVGEALVMTAFGLLVAIPAVLAYNGFLRAQRASLAELDRFAHDLAALAAGEASADADAQPGSAAAAATAASAADRHG